MFELLSDLRSRINFTELRVRRPNNPVFFCGGVISRDDDQPSALSIRDYIVRIRDCSKKINGKIILAETAQQLYRETTYPDLIAFEEDVAKLSSIVLVISESAGSLAELGAFASEKNILSALRVIVSDENFESESFVRHGPIRRVERLHRDRIGTFPWRKHKSTGTIIKSTIEPHYAEVVKFINGHLSKISKSHLYEKLDKPVFYDLLWIISILDVVSYDPLFEALKLFHNNYENSDFRNFLFILQTVGWIRKFSYSGKDYYYLPESKDPFEYSYLAGKRVRDISAFKTALSKKYVADAKISKPIRLRLLEVRNSNR